MQQLKQKHPTRRNVDPKVLLPGKLEEIHPIQYASSDAEKVRKPTLKIGGGLRQSELGLRQLNLEISQLNYAIILLS